MPKLIKEHATDFVKKLAYSQQSNYQFFRFSVNGVGTAIIYSTIATTLLFVNVNFYVSSTVGYVVAITYHYFFSKYIVFKSSSISLYQHGIYFFNCLIGLLSAATARVFVNYLGIAEFFAFFLNAVFLPFISFFLLKYFVFKK